MLDALPRLVDKSLVVAEEQDAGFRYRLLETIREYAQERVAEGGLDAVKSNVNCTARILACGEVVEG